jgi:hypothetical protein
MFKFKKGHEKGQTSLNFNGLPITIDHETATQEQMKVLHEAGCEVVVKEKESK